MNIFVPSSCPVACAEYLDDKRVVKMILETAQLLSTAHHLNNTTLDCSKIYKPTHANHPCAVWVREAVGNYRWTWLHLQALCNEYTNRYKRIHKTELDMLNILHTAPDIPDTGATPFVNCAANKDLGLDFKSLSDVHTAYSMYLENRWRTDKRKPTWYKQTERKVT